MDDIEICKWYYIVSWLKQKIGQKTWSFVYSEELWFSYFSQYFLKGVGICKGLKVLVVLLKVIFSESNGFNFAASPHAEVKLPYIESYNRDFSELGKLVCRVNIYSVRKTLENHFTP